MGNEGGREEGTKEEAMGKREGGRQEENLDGNIWPVFLFCDYNFSNNE